MDLTKESPLHLWLAYVHPALVAVGFLLGIGALRMGVASRDKRVRGKRLSAAKMLTHRRVGQTAVALLIIGFLIGVPSAVFLRGWPAFGTVHGWAGLAATVLFAVALKVGRRIPAKERQRAKAHGLVALAAMAAGLIATLTGLELLP